MDLAATRAGIAREDVELRVMPKPKLFQRFLPADNSESPAAAGTLGFSGLLEGGGMPAFERVLATSGIAPYGVLSLPAGWHLP